MRRSCSASSPTWAPPATSLQTRTWPRSPSSIRPNWFPPMPISPASPACAASTPSSPTHAVPPANSPRLLFTRLRQPRCGSPRPLRWSLLRVGHRTRQPSAAGNGQFVQRRGVSREESPAFHTRTSGSSTSLRVSRRKPVGENRSEKTGQPELRNFSGTASRKAQATIAKKHAVQADGFYSAWDTSSAEIEALDS